MTERPSGDDDKEPGQDVGPALTDALRTEPLDPRALARMHAVVGQEWRSAAGIGHRSWRPHRRLWLSLAAAAGLAAVATWFAVSPVNSTALGSVARLDRSDSDVRFSLLRHRTLHAGDALRPGDTLTTHGATLVSLRSGGTLRIAAGSVMDVLSATEIRLKQGTIYVDRPPMTSSADPLRVVTQVGTLEHLGTEFEVLSQHESVRIRVREGRIRLVGAAVRLIADAGTELLAMQGGGVSQRPCATYGPDWQWVAALAPDYDIEGKPLLGFLQWVSRELGRPLEFADPHVRDIAARTILHGSVHGHEPLEALSNVLATTSLTYEMRGDSIWVQSGP
jgi:ferric-dicitrate binding protein FerR (iron transport regulator)